MAAGVENEEELPELEAAEAGEVKEGEALWPKPNEGLVEANEMPEVELLWFGVNDDAPKVFFELFVGFEGEGPLLRSAFLGTGLLSY